jgi:hypothetical protein
MNTSQQLQQIAKHIDKLYREYIVHEEMPVDYQIGMEAFLKRLKEDLATRLATTGELPATEERVDYIRKQALCVLELTKGHTPEQIANHSQPMKSLLEMAEYVLELTNPKL